MPRAVTRYNPAMETTANEFPQAATIALGDIDVRGAVERSTRFVNERVGQMRAAMPEYAELRQQARGAKLRALQNLPELLEQFEGKLQANGGQAHWARDGAEANEAILRICRENGLRRGVKSKSMATEEIELVPFLAEQGIEMIETDLGEFIVQISDDRPSHIVMPVMHRPQSQIREIFRERLGMDTDENTSAEAMTAFARQYLRRKFLEADFGMSGGNFLIAETGSLVIITNEGNGRLSTSLPATHIAVVGIEKIIPTWRDFATLVQLLAMSGAGQTLTVYVNIINGPAAASDEDGPRQFHLVLLDNGRSEIYGGEYREALACLRCGACLNVCPVYRNVGGHAYGSVYSGAHRLGGYAGAGRPAGGAVPALRQQPLRRLPERLPGRYPYPGYAVEAAAGFAKSATAALAAGHERLVFRQPPPAALPRRRPICRTDDARPGPENGRPERLAAAAGPLDRTARFPALRAPGLP